MKSTPLAAAALVVLLGACATEPQAPDIGEPGVRILSAPAAPDTVDALVTTPLVIEARDSAGLPLDSLTVYFLGHGEYGPYCAPAWCTRMRTLVGDTIQFEAYLALTDAHGRASVRVRLGSVAGATFVRVLVWREPAGPADTLIAHYTVVPGAAAQIVFGRADSAAYVGSGYAIDADRGDRYGNRRGETVTYAALHPAVATVSAAGTTLAQAIGRAAFPVTAPGLADTAWMTVPPHGTMAAYDYTPVLSQQAARIVSVQLDGSGLRVLVTPQEQPADGSSLAWSADGAEVLFWRPESGVTRLLLVDSAGATRRAVPGGSPFGEMWGGYSRDGQWLYFNGPGGCGPLYRAEGSGAAVTQLAPLGCAEAGFRPSPSPDGSRTLVWHASNGIGVHEVSSDSITWVVPHLIGLSTVYPARWSPDGARFAFARDTVLWLGAFDGTAPQQAGIGLSIVPLSIDWSPDSQWLVARHSTGLHLIRLGDGLVLPLPFARQMIGPAWRP